MICDQCTPANVKVHAEMVCLLWCQISPIDMWWSLSDTSVSGRVCVAMWWLLTGASFIPTVSTTHHPLSRCHTWNDHSVTCEMITLCRPPSQIHKPYRWYTLSHDFQAITTRHVIIWHEMVAVRCIMYLDGTFSCHNILLVSELDILYGLRGEVPCVVDTLIILWPVWNDTTIMWHSS